MQKLFASSKYVSALYDLVEASYIKYKDDRFINKGWMWEKLNPGITKVYDRAMDLHDNMTTGFDDLWDFADFIYAITMVYFYHNDEKQRIFIDSGVSAGEKRVLVFNFAEKDVVFKFTMSYIGTKVLEVQIVRKYGKEMTTKYKFVNGENTYTSDNDYMLINTINEYTLNEMKKLYKCWIDKALNMEIYEQNQTSKGKWEWEYDE